MLLVTRFLGFNPVFGVASRLEREPVDFSFFFFLLTGKQQLSAREITPPISGGCPARTTKTAGGQSREEAGEAASSSRRSKVFQRLGTTSRGSHCSLEGKHPNRQTGVPKGSGRSYWVRSHPSSVGVFPVCQAKFTTSPRIGVDLEFSAGNRDPLLVLTQKQVHELHREPDNTSNWNISSQK